MFEGFSDYNNCEPIGVKLPVIQLEASVYSDLGLENTATSYDVLKALARKGIKEKGIDKLPNKKEYYDRAKYELETFEELGFTDYVLLNWDILGCFCRQNNVPTGAARGSATGSLILYLLDVTTLDPIPHNLYFERFVNRTRAEKIIDKNGEVFLKGSLLPDVDSDICAINRYRVVDYINQKYKGKVARILTIGTFSSKICIKEATKYFDGVDEETANAVSDMIIKKFNVALPIKTCIEESDKFQEWTEEHSFSTKNARKVEDLNKEYGLHAAGLAISHSNIDDICPLQLTKEGELVTCYTMDDVSDLMVKFDLLGLTTVSVAYKTCESIGINLNDIDSSDPFIYQCLQSFSHPCELFQVSADTTFHVAQRVKPLNIKELSDVISLSRPGSLAHVDEYIRQKQNPHKLGLHPELDNILADTKNVLIFQEQLMRAANKVFGMSLTDGEGLRKCVGKKIKEELPVWKEKIFKAAKENNVSEEATNYFWNTVQASADYLFSASHATAYSDLAAKTIFLKYKYPKHFFTSALNAAKFKNNKEQDIISAISREIKDFNIKLLPPSLINSSMDFSIEGDNIRYGLSSIKGISGKTEESLKELSQINPSNKYEVFSAAKQCGINIGVLASLIYAGALGEENRSRTVLEAQAFNLLTDREKRLFLLLGETYNYDILEAISDVVKNKRTGEDDKPIMKESRFETFKRKFEPYKTLFFENKQHEKLSIWWFEKSLLGYSYTYKLRDCYDEKYELRDLKDVCENKPEKWRAVVQVDDFFTKISQKGNRYMKLDVSDDFAKVNLMFCDSAKEKKLTDFLDYAKLEKGQIIVVSASKGGTTNFVESIKIMRDKVFMKTNQLKK